MKGKRQEANLRGSWLKLGGGREGGGKRGTETDFFWDSPKCSPENGRGWVCVHKGGED